MAKDTQLVIVESPTKAKTIKKFLPPGFVVRASMGHIRDLPQSATDIPAKLKKEAWAKLGVNVEDNFQPLYIIPKGKSKIVREIKSLIKDASVIYLATDEDREGESISWHLLELLNPKIPVKRMVFHEITKKAIKESLEKVRDVDIKLVRAQETRRILDRLYGYTLSPLIWKKIAYGLSAGRVQSTGLKMIVEREKERMTFKKADYCSIKSVVNKVGEQKKSFEARLTHIDSKRVAIGKDFNPDTGKLLKDKENKVFYLDKDEAQKAISELEKNDFKVSSVEEKDSFSNPTAPFITSTLQQEGNRKLGMSARDTMRVAQKLYENGLITYMRTDSPNLSGEAINAARTCIENLYGKEYLSEKPRQFKSKSKGAQEAHEAIRPAGVEFVHPDKTGLIGKEKALYDLIWKKTIASQMSKAQKRTMSIKIESGKYKFSASGTRIIFPGFLRAYVEGTDNPEEALDGKDVILPELKSGDKLDSDNGKVTEHQTKPAARFTEASLVQKLEGEGIGRPSTYAAIIGTVQERGYVRKEASALIPSFTGIAVIQLLNDYFPSFVDYSFTSEMEKALDDIADGKEDHLKYLKKFYSGAKGLKSRVEKQEKEIKPDVSRTVRLPQIKDIIDIKVGRYGPYIIQKVGKEEVHASIPEDIAPGDLRPEDINELIELSKKGPESLGKHPETGKDIYCLMGRYGAYLQLGEKTEEEPKPKRATLSAPWNPKNITLEAAIDLLKYPLELGDHPETGKPIRASVGRFGPYVVHDGDYRSLSKSGTELDDVTLKKALEILAEPKVSSRGAQIYKEFGKHPDNNKKLNVYDGKYGYFIKYGTKNIGIPEDLRKAEIIDKWKVEDVLKLVDAKK